MFKIDIHTHIIPEKLPDWTSKFGYEGFISLQHHQPCCAKMMQGNKFFRELKPNCWDAETRIQECDMHEINLQVLSTIPVLFNYWAKAKDAAQTSRFLNEHIADTVQKFPKRFIGLGTVPLQDPQLAIEEMKYCAHKLGLKGIEIGSHVNQWNLNAPELFPFFEAASQLNMSLFIHPWDMMGANRMNDYWLPWLVGMPAETSLAICSLIFGGVFERLPHLRFAFAHGGGSFPATIGRIEHGFNMRPDLVAKDNAINPTAYLGKFWLDTLVHDSKMLQYLIELIGSEKLCLGSDYPFPLGETVPGKLIENSDFSSEIKHHLLFQSALKWLNLSHSDFSIE